jgi:hypothetical protein
VLGKSLEELLDYRCLHCSLYLWDQVPLELASDIQLLIQVSNIAIIVLSVCDSFECFNLGSSLIEVVFLV